MAIDIPSMLVHLRGEVVETVPGEHPYERAVMAAAGWLMASPRRRSAALRLARLEVILLDVDDAAHAAVDDDQPAGQAEQETVAPRSS
ncbi:hypothetical protein CC117_30945 [Parafrankia colletiae]|uniref:Uncharacterized protein n=1 Tax=Parafrankia colletiae TaxID=573497 RepID=A0A1S1PYV0_9ACTN|nr:hypothetical protein [Parafrankia colletiae]MCK9904537.1 hypothetical protein [Frankia sp. Cpl3]OHV27843.1 hypothetical protein CC117_30945 [Parafrankia colletiae]